MDAEWFRSFGECIESIGSACFKADTCMMSFLCPFWNTRNRIANSEGSENMIDNALRARVLVFEYVKNQLKGTDKEGLLTSLEQVLCSWFSKTLGNWKACVVTDLDDDMYYEVTHDGARQVTYLDAYVKFENIEIPDEARPSGKTEIRDITLRADGYPYSPGGEPRVIGPAEEIRTVPVKYGDGPVGDDRPVIGEAEVNMKTGRADIRINPEALADADGHAKLASLIDSGDFMPMSFGVPPAGHSIYEMGTLGVFRLDDEAKKRLKDYYQDLGPYPYEQLPKDETPETPA